MIIGKNIYRAFVLVLVPIMCAKIMILPRVLSEIFGGQRKKPIIPLIKSVKLTIDYSIIEMHIYNCECYFHSCSH